MRGFFRKLRWLAHRRRREEDLVEELNFHLEEDIELRREQGLAEREAQCVARRELCNLAVVREDTRAAWGWTLLEQFAQDLRYALRTMGANRLFTVLAVASLALGTGANAAIFSFMDALLLRSLPVAEPDRLALLNWHARIRDSHQFVMHGSHGGDWGDATSGTTSLARRQLLIQRIQPCARRLQLRVLLERPPFPVRARVVSDTV